MTGVGAHQLRIVVTWSLRRRALTSRFGVLDFDGDLVTLHDRDGAPVVRAAGSEVGVAAVGRTRIQLVGPDGTPRYVTGPHAQLAGNRKVSELMDHFDAVVVPPRTVTVSDHQWSRLTARSSFSGVGAVVQHRMWQTTILGLLWSRHARPIRPG